MSHAGHKIVKCSKCERVVMQCRCMDANKTVEYVDGCKGCPPTVVSQDELPDSLKGLA